MHNERIVKRKLSDEVLDRLKRLIVEGGMKPGDEMPSERELMERFGVGRPAIREAMQALCNLGLVEINHGERARVLELTPQSIFRQVDQAANIMLSRSPDSLEYLKAARLFFERGIVREAAAKATPVDITRLEEVLARQQSLVGQPQGFMEADMRFHTEIARITGNPIFVAVSEAMLSWLQVYHSEMLIKAGRESVTLSEHATILEHLSRNDVEGAEQAMERHLQRSSALYLHNRQD